MQRRTGREPDNEIGFGLDTTRSPALLSGGLTVNAPVSPFTGTFMKQLNAVGISSSPIPHGASAAALPPYHLV